VKNRRLRYLIPAIVVLLCVVAIYLKRTPLIFHNIYIGGTVLTMDAASPAAEAVVTRGSRIVFVGSKEEALSRRRWYTRVVELGGKTLMPGFIDAHSHFLATGLSSVFINLNAAPLGKIDTLNQLYQRLQEEVSRRQPGEWIVGFNYDNTRYPSIMHPDRFSLDEVAKDNPVYVRHHSGHMGVGNSLALKQLLSFNDETTEKPAYISLPTTGQATEQTTGQAPALTPELTIDQLSRDKSATHGVTGLGLYPDGRELNGLLQEKMAPPMSRFVSDLSPLAYWRIFSKARDTYSAYGYTMVQEGSAGRAEATVLSWLSTLGLLPMRVNVWISVDKLNRRDSAKPVTPVRKQFYQSDTVKIIADGSPQGATAFLSRPYYNDADSRGIALHNQIELAQLIRQYRKAGFRVAVHANGDGAIDNAIEAVALLQRTQPLLFAGEARSGAAPSVVLVHAQTIRPDQLQRLRELDISPSFFSAHSWYWGDWHRQQTLGEERASMISPTGSAAGLQLDFTIHSDAPVTSPDPWQLLWITTERLTRSDYRLGNKERITIAEALTAMTSNAAKQAGVHDSLGSITAGKLADMIVVSDNPLTTNDVRGLQVEETIVNGVSIYRR
jgi:predicted amidohydrolase YtcJ